MDYILTSGQVAKMLATTGVHLSPTTIQRYARSGRIPSKSTPGGRYRYDLNEVLAALSNVSAEQSLTRPVLTGGIGAGRPTADSSASTLSRAISAHVGESRASDHEGAPERIPVAVLEQLRLSSRRAVALA